MKLLRGFWDAKRLASTLEEAIAKEASTWKPRLLKAKANQVLVCELDSRLKPFGQNHCYQEFCLEWIDEDGDFSSAALIWEWDEITNIPPNISAGSLVSLHMPNLNKGNCPHCCPANPSSAASSSTSSSQQPSTSSDDPHQPATDSHTDMDVSDGSDDGEDDNETLEAHVIKLKGSNYEERYQKALEEVREDMKKKKTVPVRLQFEPTNAEDCNAIEIDAHVNDVWKVIGYIPKHKIPKVTSAMRKGEVVSIKLAGLPKYEYHPKHIGYFATVVVVKKGKWPADDRNNVYNSDLSHIG